MKTLYIRIVATFLFIAIISSILALIISNFYYVSKIRGYNEQKVQFIGKEIVQLYEQTPSSDLHDYLTHIGNMGFQIYAVDNKREESYYGASFKHKQFDPELVDRVLRGGTYEGIAEEKPALMVTRYFENSIRNTVGLPLQVGGRTYALFIRPNLEQQIGEVRLILAVLLGFTFLISLVLIVISSRYIVRPVKKLTEATTKIVNGDFKIEMDITRKDEIGNLSRHFKQMAESLQQLDTMRQEFVANVSHEIQSPLTTIQGFSQSMLEKQTTPEEDQRYLRIIEEESRRLSSLSKQLLTLATLDKETNVIKMSSFRLDEQLRHVLIVTEWQWMEKQLQLELDLPDTVIHADSQLLHQVWLNLITNSIKFSQQGGSIQIALSVESDIVVTIRDSGIGIPDSELPYIFERFYKADKARNRSRSGSGLGLSIAKKIVELHQGTIEVKSEWGSGTSVTVRLPVH